MVDNTQNIVLEHLRHIRAKVDETREDIQTLTLRMGSVERILAGIRSARHRRALRSIA